MATAWRKPEIVALNKVDAIPKAQLAKKRAALEKACGHKVFVISGRLRRRRQTVLRAMAKEIDKRRANVPKKSEARPVSPRSRTSARPNKPWPKARPQGP